MTSTYGVAHNKKTVALSSVSPVLKKAKKNILRNPNTANTMRIISHESLSAHSQTHLPRGIPTAVVWGPRPCLDRNPEGRSKDLWLRATP